MIVDAHYHLEERIQPLDQLLREMDAERVERVALIPCMNEPLHWDRVTASASNLQMKLLTIRPLNPVGSVLYRSLVTRTGDFLLLGRRYRIYDLPDNATVARAMSAHPDRFYGWVFVNPRAADPLPELAKWSGGGWIGVKAHPFMHRYPVDKLDAVARFCVENRLPLLIHLGGDSARGDYRYLPDRYPALKIIYAHAGMPFYRELWDYARDKKNVCVDFASPAYVNTRIQAAAYAALGAERCLLGTDGPYCAVNLRMMIERVERMPISAAEKECILGENFQRLIAR